MLTCASPRDDAPFPPGSHPATLVETIVFDFVRAGIKRSSRLIKIFRFRLVSVVRRCARITEWVVPQYVLTKKKKKKIVSPRLKFAVSLGPLFVRRARVPQAPPSRFRVIPPRL